MTIKYDKMWRLLEANGYNTTKIRKEHLLGEGTLTALRRGTGGIDHRTIKKLCKALHCQPGDLMEYVEDK
jgi:putative transcriptional regulator